MMLWIYVALLFGTVPLQGIASDYLSIGGIKPDLGFLLIYFSGLFLGGSRGMVAGFLVGMTADVLSGGDGLVQAASGMAIGLIAGEVRRGLLNLRLFFNSVIIFFLSLFHSYFIFFTWNLHSQGKPISYPWSDLFIPKGIYDALIGCLVFWLLYKKNRELFGESRTVERVSFFASR